MENRSPSVVAGLIAALLLPLAAQAESGHDAARQADWDARMARAAVLFADSRAQMETARALLEERNAACLSKFLVNACRDDARKDYLKSTHASRRLESEGKAIEREVKKEQIAERDRQRAEEAPQREAELKARETDTEASRQAASAKIEATQADKARKAAEGEQRKAADAERLRQKQEAHERKVAEKMREAAQRNGEGARK